jgi:hypothetical protein
LIKPILKVHLFILVIVVTGSTGYAAWKINKRINTTSESTQPVMKQKIVNEIQTKTNESEINSSDWNTYTNSQYGYTIKYPKTLIVNDKDKKHVSFGSEVMPYLSIDIYDNFSNLDLKEFVFQSLRQEFGALLKPDHITWKAVKISGKDGLEVTFESLAGGYTGQVHLYYFESDNKVYRLTILQEIDKLIEKMAKTFKMIDYNGLANSDQI